MDGLQQLFDAARSARDSAYAPYSSMWTLAQAITSSTRTIGHGGETREHWQVDQLTRKVYVRSLTSLLESGEAELLRSAFTEQNGHTNLSLDSLELSEDGRAIYPLFTTLDPVEAAAALRRLPTALRERLDKMSPMNYLKDIQASLTIFLHDRDDMVIPVSESRRLWARLKGRAGVHYTEFTVFQHLDPTKGKPPILRLARELGRFYLAMYPLFRRVVAA